MGRKDEVVGCTIIMILIFMLIAKTTNVMNVTATKRKMLKTGVLFGKLLRIWSREKKGNLSLSKKVKRREKPKNANQYTMCMEVLI